MRLSGNGLRQLQREDKIASPLEPKMDMKDKMNPKEMSMRELLESCRSTQEETIQNEFVARVTRTIQGVACNRVRRWRYPEKELIQDLTNGAFVKLLPALASFEWQSEPQFWGWVRKVTLSTVEDWVRKQKPEYPEDDLLMVEDKKASGQIMFKIWCGEIEKCLRKNDATEKEIDMFWLFFVHRYSAREISEMPAVNLDENHVETILARLVRYLRRGMGGRS